MGIFRCDGRRRITAIGLVLVGVAWVLPVGAAPPAVTVSDCGAATVVSTDGAAGPFRINSGTVVVGTTDVHCRLAFTIPWVNPVHCVAGYNTRSSEWPIAAVATSTELDLATLSNWDPETVVSWVCMAKK